MAQESDKPPDVYPTEPSVLIRMFEHLLDRERKQGKHADIAIARQRSWIARMDTAAARLLQAVKALLCNRHAVTTRARKSQEGV